MKESKRVLIAGFLALILTMGMVPLFGCSTNSAPPADEPSSGQEAISGSGTVQEDEPEEVDYQPGMPVTLSAGGKDYTVESYEITTNDEGENTVIKLYGPDFEMGSDWRENIDKYICFSGSCVAGGQTYPAIKTGVQNMTSFEFEFEGNLAPEEILVSPKDNPDEVTTISLK